MFLPCLLGHFKGLTSFLSLYPWVIVAKFSFAIYLVHYSIVETMIRSQKEVLKLDEYNNIRDSFYFFCVSLLFSIPAVLLIEMPAANLEKILFSSRRKRVDEREAGLLTGNELGKINS